ncbi:hypothetical protein P9112_005250 [Eukaryota sp. TZLM1-RC]
MTTGDTLSMSVEVNAEYSGCHLKELIRLQCLHENYTFKFKRSEQKQIKAICKDVTCTFVCYAFRPQKSFDDSHYTVKTLIPHSCQNLSNKTSETRAASAKCLASVPLIRKTVLENPNIRSKSFLPILQSISKIKVGKHTVKEVRQLCRNALVGSEEDNFKQLPAYFEKLVTLNPGFYYHTDFDGSEFSRLFVALKGAMDGYDYCRPLVQVDGTHLRTMYKQILLTSTPQNAQGHFSPCIGSCCWKEFK